MPRSSVSWILASYEVRVAYRHASRRQPDHGRQWRATACGWPFFGFGAFVFPEENWAEGRNWVDCPPTPRRAPQ